MKTIYNAAGEAKELDECDAREHIASGRWFAEAPATSPATPLEASAPTPDVLTDVPVAETAHKRGRK